MVKNITCLHNVDVILFHKLTSQLNVLQKTSVTVGLLFMVKKIYSCRPMYLHVPTCIVFM